MKYNNYKIGYLQKLGGVVVSYEDVKNEPIIDCCKDCRKFNRKSKTCKDYYHGCDAYLTFKMPNGDIVSACDVFER